MGCYLGKKGEFSTKHARFIPVILCNYLSSSDPHPDNLFVIVSDISFWKYIRYNLLTFYFWQSYLAFYLTFYFGNLIWRSIWHSILAFYLAYLLTSFLAFYLVNLRWFFVVEVRGEHSDLVLAVETRRGTLWYWACSWGPAEERGGRGGGRGGGGPADIKSNNPHVTGGEKLWLVRKLWN